MKAELVSFISFPIIIPHCTIIKLFIPLQFNFCCLFHALKAFYINSQVRLFYKKKQKLFFMLFCENEKFNTMVSMDTILGWTKYTIVIVWYYLGYNFSIFQGKLCWLSREWLLFPDNLDQTIQFHWIQLQITLHIIYVYWLIWRRIILNIHLNKVKKVFQEEWFNRFTYLRSKTSINHRSF